MQHQKSYILEKANFPEIQYFALSTFLLESYVFKAATFSKELPSISATFSEEFLFHSFAPFPLPIYQLVIK